MIASSVQSAVGLCWTCNNSPDCFHRARRGPALFCEMFDDYMPPGVIHDRQAAAPVQPALTSPRNEKKTVTRAGLCLNCEHAAHCSHAAAEGGVWHCEDYE